MSGFSEPSTKAAVAFLAAWGRKGRSLVLAQTDEEAFVKSFRNLDRAMVLEPAQVEVGALIWAQAVIASQAALERVEEMVR